MTGCQKNETSGHNNLWEERWKAEARSARALEAFKAKDEEIEALQKQVSGFKDRFQASKQTHSFKSKVLFKDKMIL